MSQTQMPQFTRTALLLDLDGTLLDLASTPEAVVVEPGLTDVLRALRLRLQGALAIVTGRPIETVDRLLQDAPYAVAGEHGGAVRHGPGQPVLRPPLPAAPAAWLDHAAKLAAAYPGSVLERKARGFALHFRNVPAAGPIFRTELEALLVGSAGFQILAGLMMWEIRPVGADKGTAVQTLMAQPPFAGRVPVFIGDDVTDEDGMRVARAMGGAGLMVEPVFGGPAGVRTWLASAARSEDWPEYRTA